MEVMHTVVFLCVIISKLFLGNAQFQQPECPGVGGYVYIEHTYPCYFYACYNGALVSSLPYECPSDANYYQLLLDSGVENACTSCAKVYLKPESTTAEVPDTDAPPTETTTEKTTTTTIATTTTTGSTPMATDSPAETTTTTPSQTMMKEIHQVGTNVHLLNGRWVRGSTSLRQCLRSCEETEGCLGMDYNRMDSSCWIHDINTVCTQPQPKDNCVHFGLYNDCPITTVSTPELPDSATTEPTDQSDMAFTKAFRGQHIANGTVIPLAMEMANDETCVAICRMDDECVGADFDSGSNTCWIHSEDTLCNDLIVKEECTHYRLKDICEMPTSTSPPDQSSGDDTTTSKPEPEPERTEPDMVTDGFVESVNGFHVPGGVHMFNYVTLRQCMDSCLVTPYCLALDYDELDESCYFHFRESYCGQPKELHGVKHLKRVPCVSDFPNDVASTWYRFHVERGELLCTGCTLHFCMEACFSDMKCAGIDYDIRDLGCYHFSADTVCGPLIPKDYCIHVSRDKCVPEELSGVPLHNLALTAYPPPAGLPSGWQAYPGVRIRNGVQIGSSDLGGDTCVSMCEAQPSCMSGDYDMADGSCWLHLTPETQCGQVEGSDTVFHFKKIKCESVFGVLEPYVSPIWTAP